MDEVSLISNCFFVLLVIVLCILIYFLPAIIGRKKRDATALATLNLLLGWTLIGWVGALVWALSVEAAIPQMSATAMPAANPGLCAMCRKYSRPQSLFCTHCGQPLSVYHLRISS